MTTPTQDTSNTGEGAESPEELEPQAQQDETRKCWDCGGQFTPSHSKQWECTRCYVARKM